MKEEAISIKPPNIQVLEVSIKGTAPYVQNAFSRRQRDEIMKKQSAGGTAKSKRNREAKDFDSCFEQAHHRMPDGTVGIPAGCFRAAMISACRVVGFKMTLAKLAVFVEPDGFDVEDGTPLVKLDAKKAEKHTAVVRNQTGVVDVRVRPMWREWGATLRIKFDADTFTAEDVYNLLARVGAQVGIGEGRPDSKSSAGIGWGTFAVDRNINITHKRRSA